MKFKITVLNMYKKKLLLKVDRDINIYFFLNNTSKNVQKN